MASYEIIDKYYYKYFIHNKKYFDIGINEKFLYINELEKLNSLEELNDIVKKRSLYLENDSYLVIEYINIENIKKYKTLKLPKIIINIDNEDIEVSKIYNIDKDKIIIKYLAQSNNGKYEFKKEIPFLLSEKEIFNIFKDNGFSEIKKVKYNNFKFKNIDLYINYFRGKKLDPLLKSTPEYELYDENYKKGNKSCCNNCNKCQ